MKFVLILAASIAVACAQTAENEESVPGSSAQVKNDFRNEFDRLLVETTSHQFTELEKLLLKLSEQVADLEKTKNQEVKAQILREITVAEGFSTGSKAHFERELKRTDLDLVEKFNYEGLLATDGILNKDLAALATRVKAKFKSKN